MGQGSSRVVVGQVSHLSVEYEQLICHSRGHHLPLELPAGVCVRGGGWDTQPADLGPPLQFAEYIPVWPMHPSQCGPCIPASVAHTSQPVWPIHPSQCGPYIPASVAHTSQSVWPMHPSQCGLCPCATSLHMMGMGMAMLERSTRRLALNLMTCTLNVLWA